MSKEVGGLELGAHPDFDPYHLFVGMVPYMVDQARSAASTEAYSYRDFLVGAAVFAAMPETGETTVVAAGNLKTRPGKEKVCAEKKALKTVSKTGHTEVIGLVVVGTTDRELIEQVTRRATPTLHPCDDCLGGFSEHAMMRDETLVVSAGIEEDIYEVHTHKELHAAARNRKKAPPENLLSGMGNWSLRQSRYDFLVEQEQQSPPHLQRSRATLAQIAMSLPLIG